MDLKSFSEQNKTQANAKQSSGDSSTRANNAMPNMSENDVRRAVKYFGNMSNDQLTRELSKHIYAKKRAGQEAEIYGVIERIKPYLNDEQRKRLTEIMRSFE